MVIWQFRPKLVAMATYFGELENEVSSIIYEQMEQNRENQFSGS